jgi:lipopolysaccharide export system protein LptA
VRLTIERLRTLVLATGILLMVALGVFLAVARYRNPFNLRELPKRLGIDIQQEANGVTYSHALGAHSQFKIHASRVVQLKSGHAMLHDVMIELYGEDGSRLDRIEGDEFEYDQKQNIATAAGPVQITMMRPGVAPAIAPKAKASVVSKDKGIAKPLAAAAETAESGEIHIKTSGLTFDYKSGMTTTSQHVDFSMTQGSGSSLGATYDSQKGTLVLDHAVELTTRRGDDTVQIHAQHAEFERDSRQCVLSVAAADYRGGEATAGAAKILFREDGSAVRLDATDGFTLATATGGHLAAPMGSMDFDQHNQPRHGHLEGGVRMDSINGNRQIHGASPTAALEFTAKGLLRLVHLERGVAFNSQEQSTTVANRKNGAELVRVSRAWRSPMADLDFRDAGQGRVEPAAIHGTGGVVVTGESQRGSGPAVPSSMMADAVDGAFGSASAPASELTAITGVGHAAIEETTATGARQTATGDRLDAHFNTAASNAAKSTTGAGLGGSQIQSAMLDGHVTLTQTPAPKSGGQPEATMRATAGRAVYEGTGEWLHLTVNPRVEDGALQLSAVKIDVSQQSGDALAHGDVKATWLNAARSTQPAAGNAGMALGGQGPAHAIAQEAQLRRSSGQIVFTGHARLWQQTNSISGPVIVLDREKKSLASQSTDPAEPVRVILLSTGTLEPAASSPGKEGAARPNTPSVVRVRGGELVYSDIDRKAVMVGGALGTVVAETATATSVSNRVDLYLLPAGTHAGAGPGQRQPPLGQVDRMIASDRVSISSMGRRGTGEQLTYTAKTGEYVLTGTAAAPPRMTDPVRGNVTGEALIFNSRDDSVSIEGGGRQTRTETTVRQGENGSEPQK